MVRHDMIEEGTLPSMARGWRARAFGPTAPGMASVPGRSQCMASTSDGLGEPRPLPSFVGPYKLLDLIGEGAMGRVYRAEHVLLSREVAIKVMLPELAQYPEAVARFIDEARAVNLARSRYLIEISDLRWDPQGETYLVMELLHGENLASLLAREPLSLDRVLRIGRQLCDALTAVHEAGIIHRDLKPANVFVVPSGRTDLVKLLDFGVAKLVCQEEDAQVRPDLVVGTPYYMAPEQVVAGQEDYRCDLYALGVLLFELLTGDLPLWGETVQAMLSELLTARPPRLGERVRLPDDLHPRLERLLARCLDKDPACRPQTAADVAAELDGLLEILDGRFVYCGTLRHHACAAAALATRPNGLAERTPAAGPRPDTGPPPAATLSLRRRSSPQTQAWPAALKGALRGLARRVTGRPAPRLAPARAGGLIP